MMKSVTAENANGNWEKWATNPSGDGLFRMSQSNAGAYSQVLGNGQIRFKTLAQFKREVKKRLSPGYEIKSAFWPTGE